MPRNPGPLTTALTGVSLALLATVAILTSMPSSHDQEEPQAQGALVGLLFTALLVSGMLAAFFPDRCSMPATYAPTAGRRPGIGRGVDRVKTTSSVLGVRIRHGHHPPCGDFSSHELTFGDRSFCVSCTGLFTGGAIALPLTVGFSFYGWRCEEPWMLTFIGLASVTSGLLQYVLFEEEPRAARFTLNLLFVLGASLVLAGVESTRRSLAFDLLMLCSSLVWLGARLSLSQKAHDRICSRCSSPCWETRQPRFREERRGRRGILSNPSSSIS